MKMKNSEFRRNIGRENYKIGNFRRNSEEKFSFPRKPGDNRPLCYLDCSRLPTLSNQNIQIITADQADDHSDLRRLHGHDNEVRPRVAPGPTADEIRWEKTEGRGNTVPPATGEPHLASKSPISTKLLKQSSPSASFMSPATQPPSAHNPASKFSISFTQLHQAALERQRAAKERKALARAAEEELDLSLETCPPMTTTATKVTFQLTWTLITAFKYWWTKTPRSNRIPPRTKNQLTPIKEKSSPEFNQKVAGDPDDEQNPILAVDGSLLSSTRPGKPSPLPTCLTPSTSFTSTVVRRLPADVCEAALHEKTSHLGLISPRRPDHRHLPRETIVKLTQLALIIPLHNDSHNFSLPICALTCLLDCVSRAQAIFCPTGQHSNHASHLSSLRATTLSRHGPSITIGTTEYAPSCQIIVCTSTAANLYAATSHRTFQKDTTRLSTRAAIKGGQSNLSGAVCVTTPSSTFYTCFGS
uniref:Uncharacterized protein n=1 Tax=Caenorhabditis japonica TaxID=281687 RepID=A0A8R1E7W1_CAEJA